MGNSTHMCRTATTPADIAAKQQVLRLLQSLRAHPRPSPALGGTAPWRGCSAPQRAAGPCRSCCGGGQEGQGQRIKRVRGQHCRLGRRTRHCCVHVGCSSKGMPLHLSSIVGGMCPPLCDTSANVRTGWRAPSRRAGWPWPAWQTSRACARPQLQAAGPAPGAP